MQFHDFFRLKCILGVEGFGVFQTEAGNKVVNKRNLPRFWKVCVTLLNCHVRTLALEFLTSSRHSWALGNLSWKVRKCFGAESRWISDLAGHRHCAEAEAEARKGRI